jgi:hypothetical protein
VVRDQLEDLLVDGVVDGEPVHSDDLVPDLQTRSDITIGTNCDSSYSVELDEMAN